MQVEGRKALYMNRQIIQSKRLFSADDLKSGKIWSERFWAYIYSK